MKETELKKAVLLLAKAIERVTVNTYVEQGSAGADEVFTILEQVEKICGKGGEKEQSEPISCGHEKGGEWIQSRSKFGFGQSNCSICNGYVDGYTSYKYCPHCGTKIQGIRSKEDDEQ